MPLTVYTLASCDTCRRAVKWLRAKGIAFEQKAIRDTPPRLAQLRAGLAAKGGNVRALFNTAGADYRAQKLGEKLPLMAEADALAFLAGNGNLVKRPFAVGEGVALVGFDEAEWAAALLQK
jgi:arsenate reductase (glutaredoxin)